MKKGDVGMAKHFSKKYGNKGWAFDYPVSAIWNQFLFCQDAWWVFNKLCTLSRVVAVYVISFLYSKCSTFKAAWVCGQSYASISHNPTKCA